MVKRIEKKTLSLNKETLKTLSAEAADAVAGQGKMSWTTYNRTCHTLTCFDSDCWSLPRACWWF